MQNQYIVCPSCGHKNQAPLAKNRCASCGARVEALVDAVAAEPDTRFQQDGFNTLWLGIAFLVTAVLTAAIVVGLPLVVRVLDFEGSAGMVVAIPVWFVAGLLVGLISPGKTFLEPVIATFLVAIPTVFFLIRSQTVKTMPIFMYVLLAALGILFALIGSYAGERIQMRPASKVNE
jgi:DNA-directed RNA polymerase subunit RPC12/RpoP